MRRVATIALLATVLIVASAVPSIAWVRVWVGPPWPFWYYPPLYYPPPYVYAPPPRVIVQEPPVYVERQPVPPAPPAPPPPPQAYWHYCPSARAYYPTVPTCDQPWVKVPPRAE